jgi:uncharacterized protein YprB with RNaseH-like and TPR domain
MIFKEYKESISIDSEIISKYAMNTMAYFDIETTGFDKESDNISIISLGYFANDGMFAIKQYFAETLEEEPIILQEFIMELEKFSRWCSFNGIAFDAPFILKKMECYRIDLQIPPEHIDLYRLIRPFQQALGVNNCSLKAVEKHLGIDRKDKIHGGESAELYKAYLENRSSELLEILLLHNYEDVLNLPLLFEIIYRIDNSNTIFRENIITSKQSKYLKSLLVKHNIQIIINIEKLSKKCASRTIDAILQGNYNSSEITNIILSNY